MSVPTRSSAIALLMVCFVLAPVPSSQAASRALTLDDRIAAQEAIERVYYSHQTGATLPFEKAVPSGVLERKVRTYLKQSAALNRFWNSPITATMLQAELDRMARGTRMPDRLRELYAALGNDPVLVLECLVRPALAARLSRNAFESDARLQPQAGARGWDAWWTSVEGDLDETKVGTVALATDTLPAPRSAAPCSDDTWNNGSLDDLPLAREYHTAVWTGNRMIVWGGHRDVDIWNTGALYDPAIDAWTPTSTVNAPQGRYWHTAVWTGSRMLVWGGLNGGPLNTGGQYDPSADSWTAVTLSGAPAARYYHTAVWTGSSMTVWGGWPDSGGPLNSGGRYDPSTDTWQPTSLLNAPGGASQHTAVWTGSEMIVWGGAGGSNNGGRYDPVLDSWKPTATLGAPSARIDHSAVWTGSRMVIWGGGPTTDRTALSTGARYDPATDTWNATSAVSSTFAHRKHTAVWTGSRMIVWGGDDTSSNRTNSGLLYNPTSDVWTLTPLTTAPAGVIAHSAVWTGAQMIVWGGSQFPGTPTNLGGRFDPVANSWTPTWTGGAPSPRSGAAMAWTGNRLIVWGGSLSTGPVLTGARYDPTLDLWLPISTANTTPSGQSVVWSGSEMIVWGGNPGQPYSNAGQRYNPTTDSWRITSTLNAPSPRNGQAAVWTGSSMIVWGGQFVPFQGGPMTFFNDGAQYDPAIDAWRPLATSGTPSPRSGSAAVWSGTEMLVWGGGVAGGTYTNTGGRYDPSSDSWLPISTVGAPVSRTGFACVWAGDRMVIWGGSGSDTNEAERYDPATDSWSPGTLIGAPLRRDRPAAVSTGQELLFWSGNEFDTNNGYVQSGSRYNVPGDSWSTISLAGVPPNIGWAPATWAGDSMYLWNGGAMIGGRYCACTNATYYSDADGDGYGDAGSAVSYCSQPAGYVANPGDCNDTDPGSWQTPSEATDLMGLDAMSFAWQAPISPGGSQVLYDVIRSSNRSDYVTAADCIATDTSNLSASDPQLPPPGGIFYYLVRAQSGCVPGEGSLGTDSSGTPRTARHCP